MRIESKYQMKIRLPPMINIVLCITLRRVGTAATMTFNVKAKTAIMAGTRVLEMNDTINL